MGNVKIIVVHNGKQNYFRLMLNQLQEFNDTDNIVILSHTIVENTFEGVRVEHIGNYCIDADMFEKIYVHLSSNFEKFELFCIQRWLIINEYLKCIQYDGPFIHIDSDVMVYDSIDSLWNIYNRTDITICDRLIPSFMFFKSRLLVESLCEYIFNEYTKHVDELIQLYNMEFVNKNQNGGICDMRLIESWISKNSISCLDISNVIINNSYCDSYFSGAGIMQYDNKKHQKKCIYENNRFYFITHDGNKVKCNCIHFQGKEKKQVIYKYYISNGKRNVSKLIRTMKLNHIINLPKYTFISLAKSIGIFENLKLILRYLNTNMKSRLK